MQRTMFTTPVVRTVFRAVSVLFLKLAGWRWESEIPAGVTKSVLIAAPHTSNWDVVYMLTVAFALRTELFWLGKRQLFRFPFGGVMKWMGAIPVNRDKSTNLVTASVAALKSAQGTVHLALSPEGTRKRIDQWKTGFYYIAVGAGVPIVLGYLDYGRKVGGFGPLFHPTGDLAADLPAIKAFYAPIKGKNADQFITA